MFFDEYGGWTRPSPNTPSRYRKPPKPRRGGYQLPNYRRTAPRPGTPGYRPRPGRPGSPGNFAKGAFRAAAKSAFVPGGWGRKALSFAAQLGWEYFQQEGNPFEGWGYGSTHKLTDDFPYDVADGYGGWTVVCTTNPALRPSEPSRKVGILPGSPSISSLFCDVSGVNAANRAPGTGLPAGLTRLDLVQSSAGSPWPNRNGRPYWKATNSLAGGSPLPLPYKVGSIVQPIGDPFPDVQPMTKTALSSTGGKARVPYGIPAMSLNIEPPGPTKNPDDTHELRPPNPDEKEDKFFDNTGRALREIYGAITEVGDALDCLKKNTHVPRDKRQFGRHHKYYGKTIQEQMRFVLDNADYIDIPGAVSCMLLQHASDEAIGVTAGGAARNFNRNPYNPRRHGGPGFGSGGFARMR